MTSRSRWHGIPMGSCWQQVRLQSPAAFHSIFFALSNFDGRIEAYHGGDAWAHAGNRWAVRLIRTTSCFYSTIPRVVDDLFHKFVLQNWLY